MEMLHMIQAIADAKGSKAKMEVVRNFPEEHLEGFKLVVKLTLDPLLSFHVSSIDDYDHNPLFDGEPETLRPAHLIAFLLHLDAKGSANAADREALAKIKFGLDDNDKQVADLIVRRDLRCGLGISSFRKLWGDDFIPEMKYTLMAGFNEKKIKNSIMFELGAFSQLKSDGKRCICNFREGSVVMRSRNGKSIGSLPNIESYVIQIAEDIEEDNFDLDGELVVLDENGDILPRKTGNGIVAKVASGTATEEEISRVRYVVWDIIIHTERGLKLEYHKRFEMLNLCLDLLDNSPILPTESKIVYSLKEAKEHYQEMVRRGEEGTVVKCHRSLWTPGDSGSARESNGFKFKEEFDAEFEIVDWEYGVAGTKYEKFIGRLKCKSKCGKVVFGVGSGLKDKDRKQDGDSLIGKIVTIRYNARIMGKGSETWSLFLPRVIEFRDDKDVADDLVKIVEQEEASRELVK